MSCPDAPDHKEGEIPKFMLLREPILNQVEEREDEAQRPTLKTVTEAKKDTLSKGTFNKYVTNQFLIPVT